MECQVCALRIHPSIPKSESYEMGIAKKRAENASRFLFLVKYFRPFFSLNFKIPYQIFRLETI